VADPGRVVQNTLQALAGASKATSPMLVVDDLTIRFGGIRAVDGVSFEISGGCCGIIGPNGAGKTTLLDALAGIRPPTAGRISLDEEDVTRRSSTWRARHGVKRTFQRNQAFGWLTVEENLLVAAEWRGRGAHILADLYGTPGARRREARHAERIDEVLEICGLVSVRKKPAATLPIGQLRLMEFARAIVDTPRLLLLDEPTSGLGDADTDRLGNAVRALTAGGNCAAILVEHDLDFVVRVCDRLVVLDLGRVIADGEPATVCNDPEVIRAYVGVD
jgi:branched-chain amino acid transport system ATP-binding protein